MIQDIENRLGYLNLSIWVNFTISSDIKLQFSQEEQHSFNEKIVFPSFVGNIVIPDLSVEARSNFLIGMFAHKASVNESVWYVNQVLILMGEKLEAMNVKEGVEIDWRVLAFKEEQSMQEEFYLL